MIEMRNYPGVNHQATCAEPRSILIGGSRLLLDVVQTIAAEVLDELNDLLCEPEPLKFPQEVVHESEEDRKIAALLDPTSDKDANIKGKIVFEALSDPKETTPSSALSVPPPYFKSRS